MKKLDKKTEKLLGESERLKSLIESTGWGEAKAMLVKKCALLATDTIDTSQRTDQQIAQEIRERQSVVKMILTWLAEVEGQARTADFYAQEIKQQKEDEIVMEF
jgi:hypothetical protein